MIRLVQNNLIIPRGDTGSFSIPAISTANDAVGVFSILDLKTNTKVFEKQVTSNGETLAIEFSHGDTVNLPVGKYAWDIKFYLNPIIADGKLLDGTEINSYYAAFKLPYCEIRQTGDDLLTADGSPQTTIEPSSLNALEAVANEVVIAKNAAVQAAENAHTDAEYIAGYVDDAQQSAIAAANSAENAAVSATEASGYADNAATSATEANGYLQSVSNNADAAAQSAIEAGGYADAAAASALAAENSAADALRDANIAIGAKDDAETAATAAETAATSANNSALIASQKADNAASSAADALASKNAASASATTASNKATEASESAQSAATSASSAADSAIAAEASASNASDSAIAASQSATNALASEQMAAQSESNASNSAASAYQFSQNALNSSVVAAASEANASVSATSASASAANAEISAASASQDATTASTAKDEAQAAAYVATTNATSANASANSATQSASSAANSATAAANSANSASASALAAQGYAEQLTNLSVSATTLGPTQSATANYNNNTNTLTIGVPQGNGIETIVMNADYTLTITYTNGNSFTTAPIKGDTGDAFHIVKTYASIEAMNADYSGTDVQIGEFVMVVSTVEDPDNAKVYVKGEQAYQFIVDMSGATGIQGPIGLTPAISIGTVSTLAEGSSATVNITGSTAAPVLNFGIPTGAAGSEYTVLVQNNQPTQPTNKLWIPTQQGVVQEIPTTAEIPVEYGTGIGAVKTKDFVHNNITFSNSANGRGSFVEGLSNIADGAGAHAEGVGTCAYGARTHTEGFYTYALTNASHAEGAYITTAGTYSHAEGHGYAFNITISNTESDIIYTFNVGQSNDKNYIKSYNTIVYSSKLYLITAVDLENNTLTLAESIGQISNNTTVTVINASTRGSASHAEGQFTVAEGTYSHAEGSGTYAIGLSSHAEGAGGITIGYNSHAEGSGGLAQGKASHAEGTYPVAIGDYAHAENNHTLAYGRNTHAENHGIVASITLTNVRNNPIHTYTCNIDPIVGDFITHNGEFARVTAVDTVNKEVTLSKGFNSYADSIDTYLYQSYALGEDSHTEGYGTTSLGNYQHVQGKFNATDSSTFADIVGNGTDNLNRSNAYALDWEGNGHFMGDVYVGANADSSGGTKLPRDVQVNGTSVVSNGVANIPVATSSPGVSAVSSDLGIGITGTTNKLYINKAASQFIKPGTDQYRVIVPYNQHEATFYGLAKAAGDTTQASSDNAVGTYTSSAKNAIHTMLGTADLIEVGFVENVTGTTPSITGQANYRYVCGEVSTISITPPSVGSIDVIFESGSTASVLTVSNTVKWPTWFDPTDLDANTTYELLITDTTYGSVMTWAT